MFNTIGLVLVNIHSMVQSDPYPIMSADDLSAITNQNPSPIVGAYASQENV
jgi:hypothetical protein